MTARTLVSGLLIGVGCLASLATAGPIPAPLQGVVISTRVNRDSAGIFTYQYRAMNPAANDGEIWSVDIEITRRTGDAVLSADGLVNGPRYARSISQDAFQHVPMVPVGITGPEGWIFGLGFDSSTPPAGFAGWGSSEGARIRSGKTLDGFQLTSRGLPGIRNAQVQPDIDYDNLPDEFTDPEKSKQLRDSLIFRTVTVGPKAPPQNFVPLDFLNYLIRLLHQSRANGWVTRDGVQQSLLAKLTNAKRKLEARETDTAKNMLGAFLNEVSATSCHDFSCLGNKPLTSEAYALLFFNGQYLADRLP